METEQQWHNDRYENQGNTCAQDTFYYCSELYNPKKSYSTTYTDYADCVVKKTLSDCGHEFSTSGPNQWGGGENPYLVALQADSKHLGDMINELEDYDPSVGYDEEALLEEWHDEHPEYEYGDDEPLDDSTINEIINKGLDDDNMLMYVGLGAVALIVLIII